MRFWLVTIVLMLTACGSKPMERHQYLLRPDAVAANYPDTVALRRVEVATYLDQPGIVLQTGRNEIHSGKQHSWAEPLDEAVQRYLQVAISANAGVTVEAAPFTTTVDMPLIEIRIHRLHGSVEGLVRLVAEWSISHNGEAGVFQFEQTLNQSGDGYSALVDAHARLLDELAEAIAGSLPT